MLKLDFVLIGGVIGLAVVCWLMLRR